MLEVRVYQGEEQRRWRSWMESHRDGQEERVIQAITMLYVRSNNIKQLMISDDNGLVEDHLEAICGYSQRW